MLLGLVGGALSATWSAQKQRGATSPPVTSTPSEAG
jgi:hypothetical protein